MKKNKLLLAIVFVAFAVFFVGCDKEVKQETDALKFKEEYESLNGAVRDKDKKVIRSISIPSDNPMVYISTKDLIDAILNDETFVVYFGFSDCPWCRSVVPTLIDVAKDNSLGEIYYVDVKDIRDTLSIVDGEVVTSKKGSDDYYKLLGLLDNVLSDYILYDSEGNPVNTGKKRIFAPNVVSVVNGEAKELETGISETETDAYMELTDEMIKETYNKFKCSIKCVTENKNSCNFQQAC